MHVGVHVGRLLAVPRSPDGPQNHLIRTRSPLVAREVGEDAELLRREVHLLGVVVDLVMDEIDDERTEGERGGLALERLGAAIAQNGSNACFEFSHAEGLRDVVVRSAIEGVDLAAFVAGGREDNDRHVAPLTNALSHNQAVHIGQANIEHDQIGGRKGSLRESALSVHRGHDLVALGFESEAQCSQQRGIVIDHENASHV
jgi:hypothetical protein